MILRLRTRANANDAPWSKLWDSVTLSRQSSLSSGGICTHWWMQRMKMWQNELMIYDESELVKNMECACHTWFCGVRERMEWARGEARCCGRSELLWPLLSFRERQNDSQQKCAVARPVSPLLYTSPQYIPPKGEGMGTWQPHQTTRWKQNMSKYTKNAWRRHRKWHRTTTYNSEMVQRRHYSIQIQPTSNNSNRNQ